MGASPGAGHGGVSVRLADMVLRVAWVLLPTGFLVVLVIAWYHGERGQQRVSGIEILMLAALLATAGAALTLVASRGDAGVSDDAASTSPTGDITDEASVVVLPFADLSPNRDQEYFADGLTETLITELARSRNLRVISRQSASFF
ncbi:MAG: hypothetical protein ACREMQ_10885, partial [Longimicrobiales bacterium]